MATRKQKAKVGLFLIICALLIAGGVLLISGYRHEPKVKYWSEFHESVLGLGTNSVVTYLGVPVGTVSDIRVTDEYTAHVDMEIIVAKVTLRPGVEAKLVLYSLATGTLAIGLSGGDPSLPMLPPGSEIPSTPSLVETLSSQIEKLLDSVNEVVDKINSILGDVEEGEVKGLVESASDFMKKAQEIADNANEFMQKLSDNAEGGITDFRELVKDLDELVGDTKETVLALEKQIKALNLGETNAAVDKALQSIDKLAERLQATAGAIEKTGEGANNSIQSIQLNLRETLLVLNESLNSIKDLADYLLQDPSSLIRGKGRPKGE
ncbi:MAG: MlaD family protein [Candidatus Hydrogenedentes bacterium]|nr:MlaD family protein [Candidatus Hydrogenedentota bacterium]